MVNALDRARAAQAETEALKVSAQETTAALQETTAELKNLKGELKWLQDRITVALSTDAIQTMRLEQADCGRAIQAAALKTLDARMTRWLERGSVGEPPFSPFEAARLIQIGSALERTARGLEPAAPGELPGEALNEWAARIEAILGTEPGADEPIR